MIRKKIDFKQVEAFLIENPDFFLQKPSILEKINFPLSSRDDKKNDEKIISFKDWLIENLKNKQKSLIDNAKHNFFTQKKVHSAILQLLKKETLKSLILFLNERLSKHFDLEIISLVTSNVDFSKKNKSIFLEPEKINVLYNSHNYLIMDAVDENVGIFRGVNQKIYSNAIFSLDVNIFKSPSLLVFGSKDKHFLSNRAYDLILFFSKTFELKLQQLVDFKSIYKTNDK